MNKTSRFIFALLLPLYLSSCCTNDKCESVGARSIIFFNFDSSEVDTVVIFSYEKNTNFLSPKDSLSFSPYAVHGGTKQFAFETPEEFNENLDYKIITNNRQKEFLITNIDIELKSCGKCFLKNNLNNGQYAVIKESTVDGKQQSGGAIQIGNK